MTRQALGKGLGALIPGAAKAGESKAGSMQVAVADIKSNPLQPRKTFSAEKMDEMIKSVREKGVILPVILRETSGKYEVVAGERRFIAAARAGLKTVPAIIKNMSSIEQLEIALIENIHREDLNPVEEAMAYKNLMEGMGLTQEQLADKLGKNRATVANLIRLLKLPKPVLEYLARGDIETGHAKVLLGLEDAGRIKAMCELAVKREMSVRELEIALKKGRKTKNSPGPAAAAPEMRGIEQKMKHFFGTKVVIKGSAKKGVISVEYYSQEDLERIMEALGL